MWPPAVSLADRSPPKGQRVLVYFPQIGTPGTPAVPEVEGQPAVPEVPPSPNYRAKWFGVCDWPPDFPRRPTYWWPLPPDPTEGFKPTHRHYKHGLYEVIAAGIIEATMEPAVIYRGEDGTIWVRPQADFNAGVGQEGRLRFEPL